MGKIALAYDHISKKEKIQELSAVLYADSFFYGLWDENAVLRKTGYHPMESLDGVLKLISYYHQSLTSINVVSTLKPYVHLLSKHKDNNYFNIYFDGIYDLDLLDQVRPISDSFTHEKKVTLHYLPEKVTKLIDKYKMDSKFAHLSTALANYMHRTNTDFICYKSDRTIHFSVRKDGFAYYNQYDCYYSQDYIYFLMLIRQAFFKSSVKVHICGEIKNGDNILKSIKKYFSDITIIDAAVLLPKAVADNPSTFFDLYLCRTCVS